MQCYFLLLSIVSLGDIVRKDEIDFVEVSKNLDTNLKIILLNYQINAPAGWLSQLRCQNFL